MRKVRILLSLVSFTALTLLFLDTTGILLPHLAVFAKVQFLPAVLSLTSPRLWAVVSVAAILALCLLCGRIYCSTLCPLGVAQDLMALLRRLPFVRRAYAYKKPRTKLRIASLVAALAFFFCGFHFAVLAPYGIYGRALTLLVLPLVRSLNNALVPWCQAHGYWMVRTLEVVTPGVSVTVGIIALLAVIFLCALSGGRTWCNTVCPVGTILGTVAKFSIFRPRINAQACVKCNACVRVCKAHSINLDEGKVDMSRCVACFDCSQVCKRGAIKWK